MKDSFAPRLLAKMCYCTQSKMSQLHVIRNSTFHVLVHTISYSIELKINAYSGRDAQMFKKFQNVPNI
jgi:hypothetical protein